MRLFSGIQLSLKLCLLGLLFACHTNTSVVKKIDRNFTIGLLPYEGFDSTLIDFLIKETAEFYDCKVIVLQPVDLPSFAYYAPRNRYKADSLLVYQKKMTDNNCDVIAGLTSKDISASNGQIPDWGVFGLGMCPGKACVISTYRLQKASNSVSQLKERLTKVVLHEAGHNLGLPHCTKNPECLMTDAGGTIKQVDQEKKWLCEACLSKITK